MDSTAKKEWLSQYLDELKTLDRLINRLEEAKAAASRTTAGLSAMPHGNGYSDHMAEAVTRLIDAEQAVDVQIVKALDAKRRVEKAIDTVPNKTQRLILKWRFINGRGFDFIADEMGYSTKHTIRLYNAGLEAVQIPGGRFRVGEGPGNLGLCAG